MFSRTVPACSQSSLLKAPLDIKQAITDERYRSLKKNSSMGKGRVSIQGVKSLGGHFACLCWGFDFYEVKMKKKNLLFFKKKMEILLHF